MEIFYCDNYEEITGKQRDGSPLHDAPVETKVIAAPEVPEPVTSDVTVETA